MSQHGHPPPNVKLYLKIFATLLVLTVVTVLVSYWHLPRAAAIAVGLTVASIKAGLVIAFFMHLKGENKLIYLFLGIMAFTLVGFLLVPLDIHLLSGRTTHTDVAGQHGHEAEGASHEMLPAGSEELKGPQEKP